jgi:hypothetical protein
VRARGHRFVWRVEAYLSLHNQTEDGYVVRFVKRRGDKKVYDESRYFSRYRHGSLSAAIRAARSWKSARVGQHLRNVQRRGRS